MGRMTQIESAWLVEWARPIIACPEEHRRECVSRGGAAGAPSADASLRWPGNIGVNFELVVPSRRILCVSQIHLAAEWGMARRNLGALESDMRAWRDGRLPDASFLERYRSTYSDLLKEWGPWRNGFRRILEDQRIALDTGAIAYVNMAKCWRPPGGQYGVMRCCEGWMSIARLCGVVKPGGILVLSGDSVLDYVRPAFPNGTPMHNCGARSNMLTSTQVDAAIRWLISIGAQKVHRQL
jgi:hypothetical protein